MPISAFICRAAPVAVSVVFVVPAYSACVQPSAGVPAETIAALGRGFNAAGWLDGRTAMPPPPELLRTLRKIGMTHVRLPVTAELLMPQFSDAEIRAVQLEAIDRALTELIAQGYHVSVDLHPGDRFPAMHRDQPVAAMQALRDAWRDLARVIKAHSIDMVFAELLNEPDIEPARWQTEADGLAAFVRALLPKTTLIVGPTNWQRADSLPDFRPLNDANVVYAIHFYDPMVFTHQGHWDPAEPLSSIRQLPFPIRADDPPVKGLRSELVATGRTRALQELDRAVAASQAGDLIARQLAPAAAWQERFARPLIVNEFGVLKAQAPADSRLRWLGAVVDSVEANCWGWTHWELNQGFGLVDEKTGRPDSAVMRALMRPR